MEAWRASKGFGRATQGAGRPLEGGGCAEPERYKMCFPKCRGFKGHCLLWGIKQRKQTDREKRKTDTQRVKDGGWGAEHIDTKSKSP